MQLDNTVVAIVSFLIGAAIIIAKYMVKNTLHRQLSKITLSGIYKCNFEAIN